MKTIVFDIGNVLVNWDPRLAWAEELGSLEAAQAFIDRTDFLGRNLRADGGERFADLAAELPDPADQTRLASYPARFAVTVHSLISDSWQMLRALKSRGHPVHAITNWSAETWPAGVAAWPELGTAFEVTVVSGEHRVLKPDARIFAILCEMAGVSPGDCLFIDDSLKNVAGAQAFGMDTIHFTGPDALARGLAERGLL
jgi:FMN phosphatase YigB (HAD superfamily)